MPYATPADLFPAVRRRPPHVQEICLSAFNSAWDFYREEEAASRVGWLAVKKRYIKDGGGRVDKTPWQFFG